MFDIPYLRSAHIPRQYIATDDNHNCHISTWNILSKISAHNINCALQTKIPMVLKSLNRRIEGECWCQTTISDTPFPDNEERRSTHLRRRITPLMAKSLVNGPAASAPRLRHTLYSVFTRETPFSGGLTKIMMMLSSRQCVEHDGNLGLSHVVNGEIALSYIPQLHFASYPNCWGLVIGTRCPGAGLNCV